MQSHMMLFGLAMEERRRRIAARREAAETADRRGERRETEASDDAPPSARDAFRRLSVMGLSLSATALTGFLHS